MSFMVSVGGLVDYWPVKSQLVQDRVENRYFATGMHSKLYPYIFILFEI